jgi:hypothetical protein
MKHDNCEDKSLNSEEKIDEEQCPTRANLPPSEDASVESSPSEEQLSASDKPASVILYQPRYQVSSEDAPSNNRCGQATITHVRIIHCMHSYQMKGEG